MIGYIIVIALICGIIGAFLTVFNSWDCTGLTPAALQYCESARTAIIVPFAIIPITLIFVLLRFVFSFREVNIANVEERAKKLQGEGMDKFLHKTKAVLLDKSKRGNELYEIKMFRRYKLRFLKYEDPSTPGKIYGCFVPSDMNKADEAMAWKFYITEDEYLEDLKTEA